MIEPCDFLNLAEELNGDDNGHEAKHRTSIGRSYYAAYHQAVKEYASFKKLALSDRLFENHQRFIQELKKTPAKSIIRKIGNQLYRLKKDRFIADYELKQDVTLNSAKKSFAASKKIISNTHQI